MPDHPAEPIDRITRLPLTTQERQPQGLYRHSYHALVPLHRPRDWNEPPSRPTGHDGAGNFPY